MRKGRKLPMRVNKEQIRNIVRADPEYRKSRASGRTHEEAVEDAIRALMRRVKK